VNLKGRLLKIALSVPAPYLVKEFTSFFIFMALGIQRRLVHTGPLATACLKLFILNKKIYYALDPRKFIFLPGK